MTRPTCQTCRFWVVADAGYPAVRSCTNKASNDYLRIRWKTDTCGEHQPVDEGKER
jgi:hypothetical protein